MTVGPLRSLTIARTVVLMCNGHEIGLYVCSMYRTFLRQGEHWSGYDVCTYAEGVDAAQQRAMDPTALRLSSLDETRHLLALWSLPAKKIMHCML